MYTQENRAGVKQYLICLAAGLVIWVLCDFIGTAVHNVFFSDVLFAVFACAAVYFVYSHYCAVFKYEIGRKKLTAVRKIGHREIKHEITISKINEISFGSKPQNMPNTVYKLTVGIFSNKKFCYIIYEKGTKCLIIEPDSVLSDILKESIDG